MSEPRDLSLVREACRALSEAVTLDEIKKVRDLANAAEHYWAKIKGGEESERYAREVKIRAQRRLGEVTREIQKAKAGRPPKQNKSKVGPISPKAEQLEDAGIPKQEAARCETLAAIPPDRFEEEVSKPNASTNKLVKVGREFPSSVRGSVVVMDPALENCRREIRRRFVRLRKVIADAFGARRKGAAPLMDRFGPIARGMHREWTAIDELVAFARGRWPDEDWDGFVRAEHAKDIGGDGSRVPWAFRTLDRLRDEGPGLRRESA